METPFFAKVVAKPISFPDDIEIEYHCLDERSSIPTGKKISAVQHFTWDQVQHSFGIDAETAKKWEEDLCSGKSAIISGGRDVILDV